MRFLIRAIAVLSILALASFSAYATYKGFTLYGASPSFALMGAVAVEMVLLLGLYLALQPDQKVLVRIFGFLLYLAFVVVSVYGSFVALNAMMALPDRRIEITRKACERYRQFADSAMGFAQSRKGIVDGEVGRLDEALKAENLFGFVSSKGAGQKAMYTTLNTILERWKQMSSRADWNARIKEFACGNIEKCEPKENCEPKEKCGPKRDCCEQVADCCERALLALPSDEELKTKIQEEYKLLAKTKYGESLNRPVLDGKAPTKPVIQDAREASKKELVDDAWQELREGSRPETTRSFVFAILIDFAILVLGALQSLIALRRESDSDKAKDDAEQAL